MTEPSASVVEPPRGILPTLGARGPGIIVAGAVIGGGELINAPIQAATFGFVLLWAALLACVLKYFLQVTDLLLIQTVCIGMITKITK